MGKEGGGYEREIKGTERRRMKRKRKILYREY